MNAARVGIEGPVDTDVPVIVIDGIPGFVPTALVALTVDDAEDICDRLNRRLGLDRDAWTELAAGSMRAEDGDPDTESRH